MTILELLTRKLSHQLILPESLIDAVINHQWKTAKEATHTCNTIEFTNLGTLMIRPRKVEQEIKKQTSLISFLKKKLQENLDEKEISKYTTSLKNAQFTLDFLLSKKENI